LNVPVASIPAEDVAAHFGWLALFIGADAPASSAHTQERLGWTPTHPILIADLDQGRFSTSRKGRTDACISPFALTLLQSRRRLPRRAG
jgi:hypothetical protein